MIGAEPPGPARRPIRRLYFAFPVVFLALSLWFVRSVWLPLPARWLVVADPLEKAAAVAPLAGEGVRIDYAAELFQQGYADWYAVGNVPLDLPDLEESYLELARRAAGSAGVPEASIVAFPETVETTVQEAHALRRLAEEEGWPPNRSWDRCWWSPAHTTHAGRARYSEMSLRAARCN